MNSEKLLTKVLDQRDEAQRFAECHLYRLQRVAALCQKALDSNSLTVPISEVLSAMLETES